ncbi:MAG TPA: Hsp70 family protein, partial [Pseudonocardia sp.]|nr:Hsp70 family protein [Pseudonocardia sp.]
MGYSLGVDLGTTFVAAATAQDSPSEMVTLGDRSVVMPAVVFVREDGTAVIGEAALRRAASNPERAAQGFKRRLGDPTPMLLGGQRRTAVDLLAAVLRDVLARVTSTEGAPPESVVLTHPANWGPFRRGLFEEVPTLAGLTDTVTITEPEAAATHYTATRRLVDGQVVAIYDLGGGTFDVTVLRKRPDGIDILGAPEGIERLGGIDFDDAVLRHVDDASGGALRDLDARDPKIMVALARLRQDCVLAKESLSVDTETVVPVFLPDRQFEVPITRAQFEDLIRAQVESTIGALTRTVRSAQVSPDELSAVLLVGGSSRIPLVAQMVSEELGRPTLVDTHPKYAVALGAATYAAMITTPGASASSAPGTLPSAAPAARPPTPVPPTAQPPAPVAPTAQPPTPIPPTARPPTQAPPAAGLMAVSAAGLGPKPGGPATGPAQARSPLGSSVADTHLITPVRRPRRVRRAVLVALLAAGVIVVAAVAVLSGPAAEPGAGPPPLSSPTASTAPAAASTAATVATLTVTAAIPVGQQPGRIAMAPDGRRAYVTNFGSSTLSVIDTATNGVVATVPVGQNPAVVAVAPNGGHAYVTNNGSASVSVVDTATNTVTATVPVGQRPSGVALTPDGRRAFVANRDSNTVTVLDTATNTVASTIAVNGSPAAIALTPDGRRAYVTTFGAGGAPGGVAVLDSTSGAVTATVPVGVVPGSIAITPDGGRAYVTNFDSDTVSVIDTATNQVTATVPVGQNPANLAITPDGRLAY